VGLAERKEFHGFPVDKKSVDRESRWDCPGRCRLFSTRTRQLAPKTFLTSSFYGEDTTGTQDVQGLAHSMPSEKQMH
jgi:hypothetical protein